MPGKPHRAFASKAQWKLFGARARHDPKFRKYLHDKAHATPGGPKVRYRRLPERVGVKKNYR